MKSLKAGSWAGLLLAATLFESGVGPAHAEDRGTVVRWQRLVGIVEPGDIVGRVRPSTGDCNIGIECVEGAISRWSVTSGFAEVNVDSGRVRFLVTGLVMATDVWFTSIGTPGIATAVKGTLICNDTEPGAPEIVDTRAVSLSRRGNATFHDFVDLPASCAAEPEDIVFVVRIADARNPDFVQVDFASLLIDRWNAFGAVRVVSRPKYD